MEKRMIWNNDVGSEMDALEKDGFFAESEITSEEEKMDAAYEHINTALNDEAYNLSIDAGADIFLIGELQRWNGRGSAYANLETSNIGEAIKKAVALFSENDTIEVFVEDERMMISQLGHDNPVNPSVFEFRVVRPESDYCEIGLSREENLKATRRIGDIEANVYGRK